MMMSRGTDHRRIPLPAALVLLVLCAFASRAAAHAEETPAPGWQLTARSYPTNLPPGGHGVIRIDVYNIGAAPSRGTVTVTDTLPAGVTATEAGGSEFDKVVHERWICKGTTVVKCTNIAGELPAIDPGDSEGSIGVQSIAIAIDVPGGSPAAPNQVTIAGGGAPSPASASEPLIVSSTPAGFGFAGFAGWFSNAGRDDRHAGRLAPLRADRAARLQHHAARRRTGTGGRGSQEHHGRAAARDDRRSAGDAAL